MEAYEIPAVETRSEINVLNSRFIATARPVFSVEEARQFVARIKSEFHDASHNVPAFIIGHGSSTITHSSDDGEPPGTAGRPALTVLSGSGLGDIAVVVTRYYGGTKLGTGGLVRAYSEAVRRVLSELPRANKVLTHTITTVIPYAWYERVRDLVFAHKGQIIDQEFAADVTMTAKISVEVFPGFQAALIELSRGSLESEVIGTEEAIVPV